MKKIILMIGLEIMVFSIYAQITATDNTDVQIFPSSIGQHEVHISINKTNPLNLIVSSNVSVKNQQGHYFSIDGGITWNGADALPNGGSGSGDPSTSFDAEGRGYITTMTPAGDGYFVQKSVTSGFSWSTQTRGSGPTSGFDKEMITTVDEMQTSPYANYFYCAWTDFSINGGNKVTVNRSIDNAATFTNQTVLSTGFGHGTNVQTGPNGEVYVCWADYSTTGAFPATKIGFATSFDGGASYNTTLPFNYSGIRLTNIGNSNFGNTRVNDFPSMAVDKSCGSHRGRIYIAYPEFESSLSTKSVIRVRFSDDKGVTWSNASTINISAGRQNWFPWIAIDDLTGLVTVIYYSLDQTSGVSTNTYVAYSIDGITWQNIKVSDVAHTTAPIPSPSTFTFSPGYAGDYIGITAFDGSAFCAWMDDRNGTWQIYVSRIDFNIPKKTSSQTNLEINNPSIIQGNRNYQAAQKIQVCNIGAVTIASNANIEMVAGESIELKPGFLTGSGAVFLGKIEQNTPCTTPGAIAFKTAPSSWITQFSISKEEIEGVKLFAYPNPSIDFITIGLLNNNYKTVLISILDIQGKIIQEYKTPEITQEQIRQVVNVSSFPVGIYIASILLDSKKYSIKFNKE